MTTELLKKECLIQLTSSKVKPRIFLRDDLEGPFPKIVVHAAKIDLRVGAVFTPNVDTSHPPRKEVSVPPGGVFVVETLEQFDLDHQHVGICSPKSSMVGQRGIFIANMGQVDPGYRGWLNFTCVNFSGKPLTIRKHDPIASVMIMRLETGDNSEWEGTPNTAKKVFDEGVLDSHFGAIQAQIRTAILQHVPKAMFNLTTASWLIGIVVAILLSSWATTLTLNQINTDTLEKASVAASNAVAPLTERQLASIRIEVEQLRKEIQALASQRAPTVIDGSPPTR